MAEVAQATFDQIFRDGLRMRVEMLVEAHGEKMITELREKLHAFAVDAAESVSAEILEQRSAIDPLTRFRIAIDIVGKPKE